MTGVAALWPVVSYASYVCLFFVFFFIWRIFLVYLFCLFICITCCTHICECTKCHMYGEVFDFLYVCQRLFVLDYFVLQVSIKLKD